MTNKDRTPAQYETELRLRRKPGREQRKKRRCLKCLKAFMSDHSGNRRCPKCDNLSEVNERHGTERRIIAWRNYRA
jgi:Zn finger protein HypA/HybF involved in hydrogenase expression